MLQVDVNIDQLGISYSYSEIAAHFEWCEIKWDNKDSLLASQMEFAGERKKKNVWAMSNLSFFSIFPLQVVILLI